MSKLKAPKEQCLVVNGRPVPAARMTGRGKYVKNQAIRYLDYKKKVGWTAKAAGIKRIDTNVEIEIEIYLAGGRPGDWDNYAKSICDALNGIAYIDDCQVKRGTVVVLSCQGKNEERVEIIIRSIGGRVYEDKRPKAKRDANG